MLALAIAMMAQAASASAPPAPHDHAAPPCAAIDSALPAEFAQWRQADAPVATPLPLARPMTLALSTQPDLTQPPSRAPQPGTFGIVVPLRIETAGRYIVAIDHPAWIDLIGADGQAARPAQFGHGPACSSIRKQLRFDLTPGDYRLQFSNAATPTLRLMVSRAP
jgi:hypothetical protein